MIVALQPIGTLEGFSPARQSLAVTRGAFDVLHTQHGKSLSHFGLAYLWRDVAVRPAHRHGVHMPQLLGHNHKGRVGLDQLTGIGVPQTMKCKFIWQSRFADRRLEIRAERSCSGMSVRSHEKLLVRFARRRRKFDLPKQRHDLLRARSLLRHDKTPLQTNFYQFVWYKKSQSGHNRDAVVLLPLVQKDVMQLAETYGGGSRSEAGWLRSG